MLGFRAGLWSDRRPGREQVLGAQPERRLHRAVVDRPPRAAARRAVGRRRAAHVVGGDQLVPGPPLRDPAAAAEGAARRRALRAPGDGRGPGGGPDERPDSEAQRASPGAHDGRGRWREHLQADAAHPNRHGHAIMFEVALPAVQRVLCTLE